MMKIIIHGGGYETLSSSKFDLENEREGGEVEH